MPSSPEDSKSPHLVFGGAGFIGSHLLRRLVAAGVRDIVCADIASPKAPVEGVRYVHVDIRRPIDDALVAASPTIYDLAAIHRTPGHAEHEYYETNISGAINVSNFARRVGARRINYTSSIAVYGPVEDVRTEESPPTPVSAYGWSKLLAERIYTGWQGSDLENRLVIVRPAVVFGAGENGNFTRLAGALKRRAFVYPGRTDTVKACGYVDELLRSIEFVQSLERPHSLYNFCYPERYTISTICKTFEQVGDLSKPWGVVPLLLLQTAALPFEVLNAAGLKNPINRERILKLVRSTNIEPRFLMNAGYKYETDLAEGLRRWSDASDAEFV